MHTERSTSLQLLVPIDLSTSPELHLPTALSLQIVLEQALSSQDNSIACGKRNQCVDVKRDKVELREFCSPIRISEQLTGFLGDQ